MYTLPFKRPGQFYRGNLHTHSTESDGHLTPDQVCQFYREAGYDFIALTDHFMKTYNFPVVDTQPYRTESFTTILGAELHTGYTELGNLWHILAVGLPLDFAPPAEDEDGPTIAQRALQAGAFVAAAHPQWYGLSEADVLSLGDIHAIEVFNGTAVDHNDKADSWYLLDLLLMRGHRYTACATDDAHFHHERADAALGWVHVKAESLQPDVLLESLKNGWFYSSTGPQIIDVDVLPGDRITVRCTPASRVFVVGQRYSSVSVSGNGVINAVLNIKRFDSPYGRIIVRDAYGRHAWTNPFWFE